MVSIFGDDSADETQQRTFAVAGVAATDAVWETLEKQWLERTKGILFHATDCESDQGDYANTPHSENQALYKDLVTILAQSGAWGWGAALDLGAYRELFVVNQETGYYKAFLTVIDFFNDLARDRFKEKVKFTFDCRVQSKYNAEMLYDLMVNDSNPFLADEISFTSSRKQPRIQIADLMTRETMKELDNRIGPVKRERRRSLIALHETGRFGCDCFLREYFEDMRDKLGELENKDPNFSRTAYVNWLNQANLSDTQNNRIKFLIWFSTQERRAS
jgi:hypothetical protein